MHFTANTNPVAVSTEDFNAELPNEVFTKVSQQVYLTCVLCNREFSELNKNRNFLYISCHFVVTATFLYDLQLHRYDCYTL